MRFADSSHTLINTHQWITDDTNSAHSQRSIIMYAMAIKLNQINPYKYIRPLFTVVYSSQFETKVKEIRFFTFYSIYKEQ